MESLQSHFIPTMSHWSSEQSLDIDGISLKLLKFVRNEVCIPLAHIINRSFDQAFSQVNSKLTERYLFLRMVIQASVITTAQ